MSISLNTETQNNIQEAVRLSVDNYFKQLDGNDPKNLYEFVLDEVEYALFASGLKYYRGNQSKLARAMGLARGTLRTKLKKIGLLARDFKRKDDK